MKKLLILLFFCLLSRFIYAQRGGDDMLAVQYYEQGDYEKAAVLLQKLYENQPNDYWFELYTNTLLKTKKYADAEKLAKGLIRQQPADLKYSITLGRVYQESGQNEKATKIFNDVIGRLPNNENGIRNYISYFYRFQAYDLAITAFLQGRKNIGDDKMFAPELLNLYHFKKDKNALLNEYLNDLPTMPLLLQQAQINLASILDGPADYLVLQSELLRKLQKDPDNETLTQLLIWQYLQRQEFDMAIRQLIAIDKRLKGNDAAIFGMAGTLIDNNAYPAAIKAYEYLITKGAQSEYYLASKVRLIDAKYHLLLNGKFEKPAIAELAAAYEALLKEFGETPQTLFALTRWANLQAYYLANLDKAEEALERALKIPGLNTLEAGKLKLSLGDIYILNQQPWEAFLLYEQVAKKFENTDIGNEAKFRSAKLSFYQGDFAYAKAQADVLKASTSQLIANDALNLSLLISDNLQSPADSSALKMYADAEMLQFRKLPEQALSKLDSIALAFPSNSLSDDILMAKSRLFTEQNKFTEAAAVLNNLISTHPESLWADDALFILAGLYQDKLGKPEEAKTLYQKLITDFPGSIYTIEARKHYRKLRGDNIGI